MDKKENKEDYSEKPPVKLEIFNEIVKLQNEANSFKGQFKDYGSLYFVSILYCIAAWIFYMKAKIDFASLILFFATILIIVMFHAVSEKRSRRRTELLAGILKKLILKKENSGASLNINSL